jgi:hypothetical protein
MADTVPVPSPSYAADLALFALDPDSGRIPALVRPDGELALAGLLLAELANTGRVSLDGDRLRPIGSPPPAGTLLAEARAALPDEPLATQVPHVAWALSPLGERVLDELTTSGLIEDHVSRTLFLSRHHTEVAEPVVYDEVASRLREAAASDGPLDARTAAVLAMTSPLGLTGKVAPDPATRPHAERRIDEAATAGPFGGAVRRIIDETTAAMATAAGASMHAALDSVGPF